MSGAETVLSGGRVTPGVVRIGETVRRPVRANSDLVRALLQQLETMGFDGAPRFLGVDAHGREMLSFVHGDVPGELGHYDDVQLAAAARLLRRFHDATAGFAAERGGEVMCHNDWAPTNAVFRAGVPVALIDFDTLAPGARLWDLGYAAFTWLDLGNDDYGGEEQIRRLGVFADAYGCAGCGLATIAVHAVARQTALAVAGRAQGKPELADWAARAADWTVLHVLERLSPTGYGM